MTDATLSSMMWLQSRQPKLKKKPNKGLACPSLAALWEREGRVPSSGIRCPEGAGESMSQLQPSFTSSFLSSLSYIRGVTGTELPEGNRAQASFSSLVSPVMEVLLGKRVILKNLAKHQFWTMEPGVFPVITGYFLVFWRNIKLEVLRDTAHVSGPH